MPRGKPSPPLPILPEVVMEGSTPRKFAFWLPGAFRGLNGDNGLIRAHWAVAREELKNDSYIRVRAAIDMELTPEFGPIKVHAWLTRYAIMPMDWDNFYASLKYVWDALKHYGVLLDDSPHHIISMGASPQVYVYHKADEGLRIQLVAEGYEHLIERDLRP